jgi:hypothetical protein
MKIILTVVPAGFVPPMDKSDPMPRVSVAIGFKPDATALEQPDKAIAELATAIKILGNWPDVLSKLPDNVWDLDAGSGRLETDPWTDPSLKYPAPDRGVWNRLVWGTSHGLAGSAPATLNKGQSVATLEPSVVTWLPSIDLNRELMALAATTSDHDMSQFQSQFTNRWAGHLSSLEGRREEVRRLSGLQNLSLEKLMLGDLEIEDEQTDLLGMLTQRAAQVILNNKQQGIFDRNCRRLSTDGAAGLRPAVTKLLTILAGSAPSEVYNFYGSIYGKNETEIANRIPTLPMLFPLLVQTAAFHQRVAAPSGSTRSRLMANRQDLDLLDPSREPDVFERIALLRNYRAVLRPLGLSLDRKVIQPIPAAGQVKISDEAVKALRDHLEAIPEIKPGSILVFNPSTRFEADIPQARFHAKSRKSIAGGFLRLNDPKQFGIAKADTDGWASKWLLAASALAGSDGITVETTREHPFKITFANAAAGQTDFKEGENLYPLIADKIGTMVTSFKESLSRYCSEPGLFARNRVWVTATFTFAEKWKVAEKVETSAIVATPIRDGCGNLTGIRWQLWDADPRYNDPEPPSYPVPRSGGVTLLHYDRPQNVLTSMEANSKLLNVPNSEAQKVLDAEDLVIGYIPDVWLPCPGSSTRGRWLSLTARHETIGDIDFSHQEAVLRPATAATLDQADPDVKAIMQDMHVGQALFSWEGESLGVSGDDPAATLQDRQHDESESRSKSQSDEEFARWKLTTDFAVAPRSLPVLRFSGMRQNGDFNYKLRVRVADIAGNALPIQTENGPSLSFNYRRYEPMAAPPILLARAPESNGSLQRGLKLMVVTPEQTVDERWLVPPRVAEQMAELHGMLDVNDLRRAGTFSDCQLDEHGDFPLVSKRNSIPGSLEADPTRDPGECFPIRLPAKKRPVIPYYPDPLARGIAYHLEYLSGTGRAFTEPKFLPFYSTSRSWPDAKCIKVSLKPTTKPFPYLESEMATRTLVVRVPHGMSVKLHVNCSIVTHATDTSDQVKSFELFHKIEGAKKHLQMPEGSNDDERKEAEKHFKATKISVASGTSAFFTARTTIELVHAAKKPLLAPDLTFGQDMDGNGVIRVSHSKIAPVKLEVSTDVQSTGKLRFVADWEMPDPNSTPEDASTRRHGTDVLGEVQIAEGTAGREKALLPRTDFSHPLPDTGYMVVGYQAVGVSRFRNHYPAGIEAGEFERAGNRRLARILNCSDPVRLEVAYIVPVYDWSQGAYRDAGIDKFKSTRQTVLRIYLRGPFNLTGDDEMVGIFVSNVSPPIDPGTKRPEDSATRWGLDPLREFTREIAVTPDRTAFREYCRLAPGEFMDLEKIVRTLRGNSSAIRRIRQQLASETLQRLNGFSGPSDFKLQSLLARDLSKAIADGTVSEIVAARKRLRELLGLIGEEIFDEKGDFRPVPAQNNSGERWVIPYRPEYDKVKEMWYCDVRIQDVPVDHPFIRLAVSRFQPHSVAGHAFSPPVMLDYVQLAPDRTLTLWRDVKSDPANRDVLQVIISGTTSNPISKDQEFEIAVHVQLPSGEWQKASGEPKEEKEITWVRAERETTPGVFSGKLTWKKRQGPTRLSVREQLPSSISSTREYQSYPYIDVLDI